MTPYQEVSQWLLSHWGLLNAPFLSNLEVYPVVSKEGPKDEEPSSSSTVLIDRLADLSKESLRTWSRERQHTDIPPSSETLERCLSASAWNQEGIYRRTRKVWSKKQTRTKRREGWENNLGTPQTHSYQVKHYRLQKPTNLHEWHQTNFNIPMGPFSPTSLGLWSIAETLPSHFLKWGSYQKPAHHKDRKLWCHQKCPPRPPPGC